MAFVSKGTRVWSQRFGRVDKAGKKPSSTTMYGVGSVSKTVTAIAVMQLVDAGKVSLDAPVVRYIPDFTMASPQYRQITVRMLLNHSAGLGGTDYGDWLSDKPIPGYTDRVLAGLRTKIEDDAGRDERVLQRLLHAGWFGGGARRWYGVPRLRVEEHLQAARDEAFDVSDFDTQTRGGGARHPRREGPALQIPNVLAAGGMFSTPNDMARLAMIFTGDGVVGGKRILSSAAVQQMSVDQTTTTLKAAPPSNFRFGLGWDTVADPALKSLGIRGWTKGGDLIEQHAAFVIAPDQKLAVVVEGPAPPSVRPAPRRSRRPCCSTRWWKPVLCRRCRSKSTASPPATGRRASRSKKMTGIYLAQGLTLKVSQGKSRSLRFSVLTGGTWTRQPGRFCTARRQELLVDGGAGIIDPVREGLGPHLPHPAPRRRNRYLPQPCDDRPTHEVGRIVVTCLARPTGSAWLMANEDPNSLNWTLAGTPAVDIRTIPGLSGYLLADGALVSSVPFDATTSDTVGTMFWRFRCCPGETCSTSVFSLQGGDEYLSFASSAAARGNRSRLSSGSNTVPIGATGYVQWYRVPEASRLTMSGQTDWKPFDDNLSMVDSGGERLSRSRPRPVPTSRYSGQRAARPPSQSTER